MSNSFILIIDTGIFPNSRKIAKEILLHKNSDKQDPNNYGPISVLTMVFQVFEKLLLNRFSKFVIKKMLTSSLDSENRSCIQALMKATELMRKTIDTKNSGLACYFFLKNFFDYIDRKNQSDMVLEVKLKKF